PQPASRFDELGVLVSVAEAGSLSAAAKQLGVPKSTVGRAIARLEDEFGVSLVRRMARGPTLTGPGLGLASRTAPHIAVRRDAAVFYPGTNTLTFEGPKGREELRVNGRAASNDFFFAREAVAAGVGIGLLPWFLASQDVAAGRITRILPEYRVAGGTAYLVYP